jgi:hypothetical protein
MGPTPAGSIADVAGSRTIVVHLDDTLNNFTETLQQGEFPYNPADSLSEATFAEYLEKIRSGESDSDDLSSTGYSYFRFKIHLQCWQQARARPDGVAFLQGLRRDQWRIILCAQRDLRRAHDRTRAWLRENEIPYDYLFMAADKILFCKAWGIQHLIDRATVETVDGSRREVNVYYSIPHAQEFLPAQNARVFETFEEVRQWI